MHTAWATAGIFVNTTALAATNPNVSISFRAPDWHAPRSGRRTFMGSLRYGHSIRSFVDAIALISDNLTHRELLEENGAAYENRTRT